jgi:phenylalanyl-tRNA synthetase beta chain
VQLNGRTLGWLGELHPRVVENLELARAPVLFELDLALLTVVSLPVAKAVSKLPRVRRDMAVVLGEEVPAQAVVDALQAARPRAVESIRIFDVYRGASIGHGKKSLAILVLIRDTERTLTDAEIEGTVGALRRVLEERFGAELRQ